MLRDLFTLVLVTRSTKALKEKEMMDLPFVLLTILGFIRVCKVPYARSRENSTPFSFRDAMVYRPLVPKGVFLI